MKEDFKQWDLYQPADALEVVLILDSLRRYASGEFKSAIALGLSNFDSQTCINNFKSWRWDGRLIVDRKDESVDRYDESRSASAVSEKHDLKVSFQQVECSLSLTPILMRLLYSDSDIRVGRRPTTRAM